MRINRKNRLSLDFNGLKYYPISMKSGKAIKIIAGALIYILIVPLSLSGQQVAWKDGDIAIIQWKDTDEYNKLRENIINGLSLKLDEYQLDGKSNRIVPTLAKIKNKAYKLVLVVGGKLSDNIIRYVPDIPVVIAGGSSDLHSLHNENPHITGVYAFPSMRNQIEMLKTLKPGLETIGVLFNPSYSKEQVNMLNQAIKDTTVKLNKNGIEDSKKAATALHFMKNIDILWLPYDPLFRENTAIRFILRFSYKNNIPVYTTFKDLVEKGAVASLTPLNISLETLSIITSIMKGTDVSLIQPRFPTSGIILNIKSADKIGLPLQDKLINNAKEVIR